MLVQVPFDILRTYKYDDFKIDICLGDDCYEAWLYRDGFGVKLFMFGALINKTSIENFVELVVANIDMYIRIYEIDVEKR